MFLSLLDQALAFGAGGQGAGSRDMWYSAGVTRVLNILDIRTVMPKPYGAAAMRSPHPRLRERAGRAIKPIMHMMLGKNSTGSTG